jgi:hypothetical protein
VRWWVPEDRCGGFRSYGQRRPVANRARARRLRIAYAVMQQIADWLQKLGLGQYAQRFAENDISFVILPDLTDQDLEKIGVASLGHRRLLLRALGDNGRSGPE